jgi:hypothetical protein
MVVSFVFSQTSYTTRRRSWRAVGQVLCKADIKLAPESTAFGIGFAEMGWVSG